MLRARKHHRAAFTLTEILVVLALIAVLVALSAGTITRVMDSQKKANTQVTLGKVQSALNRQWSDYKDKFWREDPSRVSNGTPWAYVLSMAGGDVPRARVIWVKLRLAQAFPISFQEALGIQLPSGPLLPPLPTYQQALAPLGITQSAKPTTPANYESAACLLLALQQSPSGGGVKLEDLGVSTSIKAFDLPNGQTINALVDAWGTPLLFCRCPTAAAVLGNDPTYGQPGAANDPLDPQGLLASPNWVGSNGWKTFQVQPYPSPNPPPPPFPLHLFHVLPQTSKQVPPPRSFMLVPLVASAGPDKLLGLGFEDMATLSTDANDNLYGRQ